MAKFSCSSFTCLLKFSAIPQLLEYALDFFPLQKLLPLERKVLQLLKSAVQLVVS